MFELMAKLTNMRIPLKKLKVELEKVSEVKAIIGLLIIFGLKNIKNV